MSSIESITTTAYLLSTTGSTESAHTAFTCTTVYCRPLYQSILLILSSPVPQQYRRPMNQSILLILSLPVPQYTTSISINCTRVYCQYCLYCNHNYKSILLILLSSVPECTESTNNTAINCTKMILLLLILPSPVLEYIDITDITCTRVNYQSCLFSYFHQQDK